ncbi:fluoride efflux transporter CrcB [Massilibacterium senegalense]|uniref:fluoride efflux transporter CrcB n=1 Tax=Massilibacterium senegalense TaxID=1632858 RepID=UPI0007858B70|nr:fluoride efflux transporter CrcB [Massilibacterium senegalense]
MIEVIMVAIGGFFGAMLRFFISQKWNAGKRNLPIGTLFVNTVGSFLLGIVTGLAVSNTLSLLLATGFLGAFTTFSTFYVELFQLRKEKKWLFFYGFLSYILGILLAFIGFIIGHSL